MPTRAAISRLLVTSCCIIALGCASASTPRSAPPRLMTRTNMPQLSMPTGGGASRAPMTLLIEVEVDEEGRADVNSLKLSGQGTTENRAAIEYWLGTVTFQPAQENGVPVRGVYKMRVEGRTTVQVRRR